MIVVSRLKASNHKHQSSNKFKIPSSKFKTPFRICLWFEIWSLWFICWIYRFKNVSWKSSIEVLHKPNPGNYNYRPETSLTPKRIVILSSELLGHFLVTLLHPIGCFNFLLFLFSEQKESLRLGSCRNSFSAASCNWNRRMGNSCQTYKKSNN